MSIRVGILGYGNLGRGVECAIKHNPDMELVAVFTRRAPETVKILTETATVYSVNDAEKMKDKIDVMIICGGSATDLPKQTPEYAKMFNVIDSFDTHARIPEHFDFISLSDVCDKDTALLIKREVSDGVIAPGYTEEALEILKQKKKGNYNVIQIDENYVPAPLEHKEVFGVTFEQGRQELVIDDEMLSNIVTENKELTEEAKRDMKISLIILKYTQSNSVCFVKDGQAIGVGAGQQSRVHCTRLAGQKADNWFLRQCPKVLNLPFKDSISRAERDNAIDVYIGDEYMDVLADGMWEKTFTEKPEVFTKEEKRAWLDQMTDVTLGSDAFFPFSDNIERAHKSGVKYIAQPGGSVRDADVIDTCNKYGMAMSFTGIRLFHH